MLGRVTADGVHLTKSRACGCLARSDVTRPGRTGPWAGAGRSPHPQRPGGRGGTFPTAGPAPGEAEQEPSGAVRGAGAGW